MPKMPDLRRQSNSEYVQLRITEAAKWVQSCVQTGNVMGARLVAEALVSFARENGLLTEDVQEENDKTV